MSSSSSATNSKDLQERLVNSLQLLDSLLQFLTKATGRTTLTLQSFRAIIPVNKRCVLNDVPELSGRGVLHLEVPNDLQSELEAILCGNDSEKDSKVMIGFPPIGALVSNANKQKPTGKNLHGSTKAAAKRRLSTLKNSFKTSKNSKDSSKLASSTGSVVDDEITTFNNSLQQAESSRGLDPELRDGMVHNDKFQKYSVKEQHDRLRKLQESFTNELSQEAKNALKELEDFLGGRGGKCDGGKESDKVSNSFILPKQAAYAGSKKERQTKYSYLTQRHIDAIPIEIRDAFGLQLTEDGTVEDQSVAYQALDAHIGSTARRKLYSHQTEAIKSSLDDTHTLVCTGTGSGKSLCFLLPILARVMKSDTGAFTGLNNIDQTAGGSSVALLIFPTKALANDQLTKLNSIIQKNPLMEKHIRPGIIDGDTPHQSRGDIANQCNILLSNPDTLHAAILPGWKGTYKNFLARLNYIVIDELHIYEGAFGAHVSLVLSRLIRLAKVANCISEIPLPENKLIFIGCSATIGHPEDHFRLICPIAKNEDIKVLAPDEDGSPCATKHFFVWNPPLLNDSGDGIGRVVVNTSKPKKAEKTGSGRKRNRPYKVSARARGIEKASFVGVLGSDQALTSTNTHEIIIKRCHAADETARLLAYAVRNGIRSIAFCKTRMLAEWVYERCVALLKAEENPELSDKVEIYRGGYAASVRRNIEARLFKNELFGVVGTSALELGIDLGGIALTLHCGFPGSYASLMQQAGRAGRGASTRGSSFAIMICFSSPSEQHIWKHPKGLLGRGLNAPPSIPLNPGIVEGHLLCASEEFPLCGNHAVTALLNGDTSRLQLVDSDLFGGASVYNESLENLCDAKQVQKEKVNHIAKFETFSKHPSIDRPSSRVSLRSIEPINYSIVDMSHPRQANRNDKIHDKAAVMDTIPYSRVFYHAYPGAILMHRGRKYKIHSMNSPPAFATAFGTYRYDSSNLGAYAKPSTAAYSTRALSITLITIVKQLDRVEIQSRGSDQRKTPEQSTGSSEEGIAQKSSCSDEIKEAAFVPPLAQGTIAGNGVVTVKRTVHGYKKLSLVNREELSRSEISLPSMEYDTNAMWIDAEASVLSEFMPNYSKGIHALSHAIVAVAPLFVPCTPSDLDCDHAHYECTKITLFDVRAGGAGTSSQLWRHFFKPDGVLGAAIDLLSECPSECDTGRYKGGCPGCIQAVPCISFHEDLCRKSGLQIARRMLGRIKKSSLYQVNAAQLQDENAGSTNSSAGLGTPRRKKRQKALKNASNLVSARKRNIVVGRPSWPTDNSSTPDQRTSVEPCDLNGVSNFQAPMSPQGGFIKY